MQEKKQINVEIGARIKAEREKAGLTQERFSELIGLGTKSVSAFERGAVGISFVTLKKSVRYCPFPEMPSYSAKPAETRTMFPVWLQDWNVFPRRNMPLQKKSYINFWKPFP